MKIGTRIKIRDRYHSDIYELRKGKFIIEFDMYPGFSGYYGEFNGKHFVCVDTVDKYNPHYPGNKGEVRGLDLLDKPFEIINYKL